MILHACGIRRQGGRGARLLAAVVLFAACRLVEAQNFYQVSNPRTYRIDPPMTPPLADGLVPQALTSRTVESNGNSTLILTWQTSTGTPSAALEVAVNLDIPPIAESANDATLIAQIPNLAPVTAMDYQSDQQVLTMTRTVGTVQAAVGVGPFVFDDQGDIVNVFLNTRIAPPVVTGGLGTNLGPQGIAFGGIRNVGGGVYDTAIVVFAGSPAGLWAADLSTARWLDANLANTSGANAISPIVPWSGDTGGVNQDPGGHQLRGVDVLGDIAFLLTARQQDANDPNSIQYFLIQANLLVQQRLAVVNLGDLFDQRITAPSAALGGDLDVTARSDGTVRIVFSTPGSGKDIGVLDGQLVPIGSAPIAGGSTPPPESTAVIWVCPGFGIAIPIVTAATLLWLSGSAWVRRPVKPRA